jgi:tetratricopeptide (TPR) repeat protein
VQATTLDAPLTPIAAEIGRIREFIGRGEFEPALSAAQALRGHAPENREMLYMIAVCLRQLKRIPEALGVLAELERHHPQYSGLFQERGHCHVAMRSAEAAAQAFLRAVTLNPSRSASWNSLQVLYRMMGRAADAESAAAQAAKLASLPQEILNAFALYADGEFPAAEQIARRYLQTHGDHVEAMRLLAQIGMKLDATTDDAELLLRRVVAIAPHYEAARYEYAMALLARLKHALAREEMDKLLKVDPGNVIYRSAYATVLMGFGDCARALLLYREILAESPNDPELNLSAAHVLKTLGRTEEAIERCRSAAAVRADYGEAYWSLANLKTYRFTDDEIARMRAAQTSPDLLPVDRYHLWFALGKALEDRGEYAESFDCYERGNALKKAECRYQPEELERNTRQQVETCTQEFFAVRRGFGCSNSAPIFIVGMPRAGSTLIEQILSSHSQVEGTMELADIPRLVQDLRRRGQTDRASGYAGVIGELTADECRRLGEKYLDDTRIYRKGEPESVPFFVDKMPNNFRHLGLIHLILPHAKIIDARRDPLACCFSNYKQLFASGQQFTYGLDDVARYYRTYVQLMTHWSEVLPGKILRIRHEDVVEDLNMSVRRILEFCELDFEPGCVEFYKTERTVHSASSEQVRRPIYREGVEQWRHYEPWLGPLKDALGPLLEGT